MKRALWILMIICVTAVQVIAQTNAASKPMTDDDVIALTKAGLSADVVVAKIHSTSTDFDTSTDALAKLKASGVADNVILAMVTAGNAVTTPTMKATALPTANPMAQPPASDGKTRVYISDSNSWAVSGGWAASNGSGGGGVSGGAQGQTAELIKTFGQRCPEVVVTDKSANANYAVIFDHEGGVGWARHKDKIAVFARNGDSVFSDSTRTLGNSVKDACAAIDKDAGLTHADH